MGCQEAEERGRILVVEMKPESGRTIELSVWKKLGLLCHGKTQWRRKGGERPLSDPNKFNGQQLD